MINECFNNYENIHNGRDAVLFGTGHTLSEFIGQKDKLRKDVITVGVNRMVYSGFNTDYYFTGDSGTKDAGYSSDSAAYNSYKPTLGKFYRETSGDFKGITKGHDAEYYKVTSRINKDGPFHTDIREGLGGGVSIIFEPLQFILHTGIARLFLIGHDCDRMVTEEKYCSGKEKKVWNEGQLTLIMSMWSKAKAWIDEAYKHVQVYIINPVMLNIFEECNMKEILNEG